MKKHLIIAAILFLGIASFAQAPESFNYQAVLRDADGTVKANESVAIQIIIRQGTPDGIAMYLENHNTQSTELGLINLRIGNGTTSDDFSIIDWSAGPYFLELTVNGVEMGTSQLISVPYALHANTAEKTSGITATNIANWNTAYGWGDHSGLYRPLGYVPAWSEITDIPTGFADGADNVDDADHSVTNEIQVLSVSGSDLTLSKDGGTVAIPGDNWGTQAVTTDATLTGNGTTGTPLKIADNGVTTMKIANSAVTVSKISNSGAVADNVLQYTGSAVSWGSLFMGDYMWSQ